MRGFPGTRVAWTHRSSQGTRGCLQHLHAHSVHPAHLTEEAQVQNMWPKPRLQHLVPPSGPALTVPCWPLSSPPLPDVAGGSFSLLMLVPGLLWNHPPPGAWWQPLLQWWICGQRFLLGMGLNPWGWGVRWSWGDRIAWLWAQFLSLLLLLPPRLLSLLVTFALAIKCPRWWMLLLDSILVCCLWWHNLYQWCQAYTQASCPVLLIWSWNPDMRPTWCGLYQADSNKNNCSIAQCTQCLSSMWAGCEAGGLEWWWGEVTYVVIDSMGTGEDRMKINLGPVSGKLCDRGQVCCNFLKSFSIWYTGIVCEE